MEDVVRGLQLRDHPVHGRESPLRHGHETDLARARIGLGSIDDDVLLGFERVAGFERQIGQSDHEGGHASDNADEDGQDQELRTDSEPRRRLGWVDSGIVV